MADMEPKNKFKILKGDKGLTPCETQLSAEDRSFYDSNDVWRIVNWWVFGSVPLLVQGAGIYFNLNPELEWL